MRVLILGGTGRTGAFLVDEALKQGYTVNILLRDKSKWPHSSTAVTLFEGTPTDKVALQQAMQGCQAILSTLNISRTSDFPWAPLRTPTDFLSASMKNIIELTDELQISRLIITTAWGVNETKKDVPGWFRWVIDHSNVGYPYRDHEVQEALLLQSNLNFTVVRPVGLTNSLNNKTVRVSINNQPKPRLTIGRQNVARFMIKILQQDLYSRQFITLSEQ